MVMKRKASSSLVRRAKRARTSPLGVAPYPRYSSIRRPEVKYIDVNIANAGAASTYYVDGLNLISQGTGQSDRLANKITVLGMDYRGFIGDISDKCTCYILQCWDTTTPGATYFSGVGGFPIPEKSKVLYQRTGAWSNNQNGTVNLKFRYKTPIQCLYNGSLTTSGVRNKLWHVMVCTVANANTDIHIRVYYIDS